MEGPQLNRATKFSYTCNRCMSCCHDTHIALDPHEIARLARNRHLTTRVFIDRYLVEGGIVLRNRADKSCSMLDAQGCTVYADRPQVCRTYPLMRLRTQAGEVLGPFKKLPTSTGQYGCLGTISEFFKANDCEDFFSAKDHYYDLVFRIIAVLAAAVRRNPDRFAQVRDLIAKYCSFGGTAVPALLDVDRVVSDYCAQRGLSPPADVEQTIEFHIAAVEKRLDALSGAGQLDPADHRDQNSLLMEVAGFAGALGAATQTRLVLAFVAEVFGYK